MVFLNFIQFNDSWKTVVVCPYRNQYLNKLYVFDELTQYVPSRQLYTNKQLYVTQFYYLDFTDK
jgi:hypothetical protein